MNYELNTYEFTIPTWALPALVNGDLSGLDDRDEAVLNEFIKGLVDNYGHAFLSLGEDTEPIFSWRNDIDGQLGADTITMYLIVEGGKK